MKGSVTMGFLIVLMIPFILFIPDLAIYGIQSNTASEVVSDITKEAEMRGGVTPELKNYAEKRLDESGLKQNGYTISYNVAGQTGGMLQKTQRFDVTVSGKYRLKSFNFLNTGSLSIDVIKSETGSSKVWIR